MEPSIATQLRQLFTYDATIYDANYYKRLTIGAAVQMYSAEYATLTMPGIVNYTFDDEIIYSTEMLPLPDEIIVLYREYALQPNTLLLLYTPKQVSGITSQQLDQLRNIDMVDVALLHPIGYVEVCKVRYNDVPKYQILCYLNVLGDHSTLPPPEDRYLWIELVVPSIACENWYMLHTDTLLEYMVDKTHIDILDRLGSLPTTLAQILHK